MSGFSRTLDSPRSFGIIAMVLALLVQLPFANDDFDIGFESMIGGYFEGSMHRAWQTGGFWALGGRPLLSPLPTMPPTGRTYANHPPLAHWLFHLPVYLFGLSEFSIRLVPILCSALTALLLATFMAQRLGPMGGLSCAALWAASPMVFFYGRMANYEVIVLLLCLSAWLVLKANTKKFDALAALLLALAAMSDWAAGFFLPGIAISTWHSRFGWRAVVASSLGIAIGVFIYLAILVSWEGGFQEAWHGLTAARNLATQTESISFLAFMKAQGSHVLHNFGVGGTLIAAISVALSLARIPFGKGDVLDQLILTSFLASVINVGLFPARAFNHDFWWYYLLPAVVVSCSRCVAAFYRSRKLIGIVLLAALLAEGVDRVTERYHEENTGESRILADQMDARFGENSLVLMTKKPGSWQFVCDAWIYDDITNIDMALDVVRKFQGGQLSVDTLGFWYPIQYDYADPAMLRKWKAMGAEHEQFGAAAILKFKRDD